MYLLCQRVLRHVSALWLKTAHCFPHTHEQGTCPVYWSCNRWLTHISCVSTCAAVQRNRMSLMFLPCSCTSSHKKQQKTCAHNEWCVGHKVLEILLRWSTWLRVRGGAARHSWNTSLVKFISFKNCKVPDGTTYLKIWALKDVKNLGWQCQKSQ